VLFPPVKPEERDVEGSAYERLAIPHTFQPRLSVAAAAVAAIMATLRIVLGCLLFAVWGAYTLVASGRIRSLPRRVALMLASILLFLLLGTLLLAASAALERRLRSVWRR